MRALVPLVLLVLVLPLALAGPGGGPATLRPRQPDPDVLPLTPPVGEEKPFASERWECTEGVRTRSITVPTEPWNRVVLTLFIDHESDIYDRLFGVSIAGVEVLHGTTPRADMTLRRDVTEYAALLPPGATVPVSMTLGTYVGWMNANVMLSFYQDETVALVAPAMDHAIGVFQFEYVQAGPGATVTRQVSFPADAPSRAIVEVTTSGHGPGGEFFYLQQQKVPPTFHVLVDGTEIGRVTVLPYVYALAGFGSLGCGKTDQFYNTFVHPVVWWSAFQAADIAGVHVGVGEIPSYRADVPEEYLPLLAGAREVKLVQEGGNSAGANWVTSLSFLLEE